MRYSAEINANIELQMQKKISKTLEGIIARVIFDTTRAGHTRALKDYLMIEILRTEGSLAHQLLASRLKDWELYQMTLRIERTAEGEPATEHRPEEFFESFIEELRMANADAPTISTIHAMQAIANDSATCTSRVMKIYRLAATDLLAESESLTPKGIARRVDIHRLDNPQSESLTDSATERTNSLLKFGSDLTQLARDGKIDPVIGRDAEIERVVQILSRRKKNNPVLIGRSCADYAKLATSQCRLEDVGCIEAALSCTSPHNSMNLIDKENRILRSLQLLE